MPDEKFLDWMNQVNELAKNELGVTASDSIDLDYAGMFADGLTPRQALDSLMEGLDHLENLYHWQIMGHAENPDFMRGPDHMEGTEDIHVPDYIADLSDSLDKLQDENYEPVIMSDSPIVHIGDYIEAVGLLKTKTATSILPPRTQAQVDAIAKVDSRAQWVRSRTPNEYVAFAQHSVVVPPTNEDAKLIVTPSRYRMREHGYGIVKLEDDSASLCLDVLLIYQGYAIPLVVNNEWSSIDSAMRNSIEEWGYVMGKDDSFAKKILSMISQSVVI